MRAHAAVRPEFWTRGSGKRLRGNPAAQVLACYLMTSPHTNMVGIFHLAIPIMVHETGLSTEQVAGALRVLAEEDFAHYDDEEELVYLPAGARTQIGESMSRRDKRHAQVWRQIDALGAHRFASLFRDRYGSPFQAPSKPLPSPSEGAAHGASGGEEAPPKGRVPVPVPVSDPDPDQEGVQGEGVIQTLDGVRDGDGETVCPLDLADRWTGADAMASALRVPRAAVDAVVADFVAYWTIGGGAGKRRSHWARKLREEVRRKAEGVAGSLPSSRGASSPSADESLTPVWRPPPDEGAVPCPPDVAARLRASGYRGPLAPVSAAAGRGSDAAPAQPTPGVETRSQGRRGAVA